MGTCRAIFCGGDENLSYFHEALAFCLGYAPADCQSVFGHDRIETKPSEMVVVFDHSLQEVASFLGQALEQEDFPPVLLLSFCDRPTLTAGLLRHHLFPEFWPFTKAGWLRHQRLPCVLQELKKQKEKCTNVSSGNAKPTEFLSRIRSELRLRRASQPNALWTMPCLPYLTAFQAAALGNKGDPTHAKVVDILLSDSPDLTMVAEELLSEVRFDARKVYSRQFKDQLKKTWQPDEQKLDGSALIKAIVDEFARIAQKMNS